MRTQVNTPADTLKWIEDFMRLPQEEQEIIIQEWDT